ncbi:hypothetical protein FRC01_006498 [Tulasnella sp. 417]|nr:hypothetical protein FRC01_006498 [Tulasnella sp. 417]
MSLPPAVPVFLGPGPPPSLPPSPLPPGWTESTSPTGHSYYYHAATNQSTYVRPLPVHGQSFPLPVMEQESSSTSKKKKKAKRERPVSKTAIPGTSWSRVQTSEGNFFYFNEEKKQSIAEAVAELEQEEEERAAQEEQKPPTPPPAAFGIGRLLAAERKRKQEKPDEKDAKEPPKDDNAPQLSPRKPTLLQEKDINPLTPYDSAIPQLINDPRYVLLPNIADRHAAFNEYYLDKSRAQRAAKAWSSQTSPPPTKKLKAHEAYGGLLRDELKSARTSWDEWRKKWKKDRRFFGFGRDDREREKTFKEWRNSLGEPKFPPSSLTQQLFATEKRKKAQKAEADFFALLRENENLVAESTGGQNPAPLWKDVKKHATLYSDPRYDAVGSSSLREELFQTYLKARINPNNQPEASSSRSSDSKTSPEDPEAKRKREQQERQQKAPREREQQALKDKAKVEKDITRSMGQLSEKESVDEFMTLLTDAIRESYAPQRISLFNAHVQKLRGKRITALFAVFEGHTPGLGARFEDLPESVYTTSPAVKLGLGQSKAQQEDEDARSEMRRLWEDWQAERNVKARDNFQKLLEESHFVGFWAGVNKLGKERGSSSGGGMGTVAVGVDDLDGEAPGEEEDNGLGRADLKTLAKGIGEKQIEDVLKHDKRYRVFDHIPDERERWIQEFVSRMPAPKLLVHVPDKS